MGAGPKVEGEAYSVAADSGETFDYVIVGAGSAGCILADRLSAEGGHTVCLLEAGPPDTNVFIHIPAGFMKTLINPSINWLYDTEAGYWTGGRVISQARGKTLGGSGSINGHVYTRGQRLDFDGWAQRGNRGWGYADVLPYFRRSEQRIGEGDNTYRGREGKVRVTDMEWRHPLCDAFIEGATQLGIPRNLDYNGATQEGISYVQRMTHNGRRVSTARAYLNPAKSRPNLSVRTNAHVTRILLDGKLAVGVTYAKGGRGGALTEVRANREVILSGGAINSPQLLALSGIGPKDLLSDLGIEVTHALAGVGENLRDHYATRFAARVKNIDTINERSRGLKLAGEIIKYCCGGNSIVSLSPAVVNCFWNANKAARYLDLQIVFTPGSWKEGVQNQLDDEPGFSIGSWQQRPESKGWVRVKSVDPFDKPIVQPNYLAEESDRRVLLAGMKLARQLMRTEPLKPYFDYEQYPGEAVQTDDELLEVARQRGTTTFHVMGTCRMGPEADPTAVVDDRLRVHDMERLRVIDASIIPNMLSGNLNAAVMVIAEKGADMILAKPAPEPVILPD